jgi:hypothetical protein
MEADLVLNAAPDTLGLSGQFCLQCRQMEFYTLKEVVSTPPGELMDKPGFTYRWLGELSEFLNKEHLLCLLQPVPGKSYG